VVLIANTKIDVATAIEINKYFVRLLLLNMMQKQLKFYNKRKTLF
jgi:hypothetical protein